MKKIKIAILGCGKQASKHISGLSKCSNVEIVLMDKAEDAASHVAKLHGLKYVLTLDEVFQDNSITGVSICTPTPTHYDIICQAIAAGKHFLCEKPLVEEIWQAKSIEERLAATSLVGSVGYIYRQAPIFQKVKQILEYDKKLDTENIVGDVHTALFRIGGRGSHAVWKHRKDSGGGAIKEMLVHQLDLANWFFGNVEEYQLIEQNLKQNQRKIKGHLYDADAEDLVILKAKYGNGTEVFLWADMLTSSFYQSVELLGPEGNIAASIVDSFDSFVFASQANTLFPLGKSHLKFSKVKLFENQMGEFVAAIRTGANDRLPTVTDSLKVQNVINNLYWE